MSKRFYLMFCIGLVLILAFNMSHSLIIVTQDDYIDVSVTIPWTNTGIQINQGDTILIYSKGHYTFGGSRWSDWSGPDGFPYSADENFPAPNSGRYCLIAKIGENEPFTVGEFFYFISEESGELALGINDTHHGDNEGVLRSWIWHNDPTTSDRKSITKLVPNTNQLSQNFPNPFNPMTTISYELQQSAKVELTIFNSLGERVRTLVNEKKSPNTYQVIWNGKSDSGNQLPSGNYFYQLKIDDEIQNKKMILIK